MGDAGDGRPLFLFFLLYFWELICSWILSGVGAAARARAGGRLVCSGSA